MPNKPRLSTGKTPACVSRKTLQLGGAGRHSNPGSGLPVPRAWWSKNPSSHTCPNLACRDTWYGRLVGTHEPLEVLFQREIRICSTCPSVLHSSRFCLSSGKSRSEELAVLHTVGLLLPFHWTLFQGSVNPPTALLRMCCPRFTAEAYLSYLALGTQAGPTLLDHLVLATVVCRCLVSRLSVIIAVKSVAPGRLERTKVNTVACPTLSARKEQLRDQCESRHDDLGAVVGYTEGYGKRCGWVTVLLCPRRHWICVTNLWVIVPTCPMIVAHPPSIISTRKAQSLHFHLPCQSLFTPVNIPD